MLLTEKRPGCTQQRCARNQKQRMHTTQRSSEYYNRPQQQRPVNIGQRTRQREQRDPEEADRRCSGKLSERHEPTRMLELGDELSGGGPPLS
jgi:hypothetical protein